MHTHANNCYIIIRTIEFFLSIMSVPPVCEPTPPIVGEADLTCHVSSDHGLRQHMQFKYITRNKENSTLNTVSIGTLFVRALCECHNVKEQINHLIRSTTIHWKQQATSRIAPQIARRNNTLILFNPGKMAEIYTNATGNNPKYSMFQDEEVALHNIQTWGSITVVNSPE